MKLLSSVLALAAAASVAFVPSAHAAGDIDLCVSNGRNAGFSGDNLVTAVAVGMAESRCDPSARYVNNDSHRSVDRGLWQINDLARLRWTLG